MKLRGEMALFPGFYDLGTKLVSRYSPVEHQAEIEFACANRTAAWELLCHGNGVVKTWKVAQRRLQLA
jgi:hypothetical protein